MIAMISPFKKILVAIDFSDTTDDLIHLIIKFHYTFAPDFILLHVLTEEVLGHLEKSSLEKEKAKKFALQETLPLWEKLEKRLYGEGVSFEREFREGIPHKAIASHAEEKKCDFIVMGCHLKSTLQELFVGNTPKNILNATNIPVLLVKPSKNF